ncbi:hypothetical protein ACFY00_09290 [Kitasatospora sp. NPDC001540]|uniref:hypothetical protein n=1 Tax=Kitasatospora sp. NPDC001540 TaxID=3364014 RepID=UPI0036B4B434
MQFADGLQHLDRHGVRHPPDLAEVAGRVVGHRQVRDQGLQAAALARAEQHDRGHRVDDPPERDLALRRGDVRAAGAQPLAGQPAQLGVVDHLQHRGGGLLADLAQAQRAVVAAHRRLHVAAAGPGEQVAGGVQRGPGVDPGLQLGLGEQRPVLGEGAQQRRAVPVGEVADQRGVVALGEQPLADGVLAERGEPDGAEAGGVLVGERPVGVHHLGGLAVLALLEQVGVDRAVLDQAELGEVAEHRVEDDHQVGDLAEHLLVRLLPVRDDQQRGQHAQRDGLGAGLGERGGLVEGVQRLVEDLGGLVAGVLDLGQAVGVVEPAALDHLGVDRLGLGGQLAHQLRGLEPQAQDGGGLARLDRLQVGAGDGDVRALRGGAGLHQVQVAGQRPGPHRLDHVLLARVLGAEHPGGLHPVGLAEVAVLVDLAVRGDPAGQRDHPGDQRDGEGGGGQLGVRGQDDRRDEDGRVVRVLVGALRAVQVGEVVVGGQQALGLGRLLIRGVSATSGHRARSPGCVAGHRRPWRGPPGGRRTRGAAERAGACRPVNPAYRPPPTPA